MQYGLGERGRKEPRDRRARLRSTRRSATRSSRKPRGFLARTPRSPADRRRTTANASRTGPRSRCRCSRRGTGAGMDCTCAATPTASPGRVEAEVARDARRSSTGRTTTPTTAARSAKALLRPFPEGRGQRLGPGAAVLLNVRHADGASSSATRTTGRSRDTEWTSFYLDAAGMSPRPDPLERRDVSLRRARANGVMFRPPSTRRSRSRAPRRRSSSSPPTTRTPMSSCRLASSTRRETRSPSRGARPTHPDRARLAAGLAPHARPRALDSVPAVPPHDRRSRSTRGTSTSSTSRSGPLHLIPAGYTLALASGKDYQYSEVERVGWFTMTGVGPFKHDDPANRPPDVFGGGCDDPYRAVESFAVAGARGSTPLSPHATPAADIGLFRSSKAVRRSSGP